MTTVILKPKKEQSLLRKHPWVFSGAIGRVLLDATNTADTPSEGEIVAVQAHGGEVLGYGHWQVGSIAVRILSFGNELPGENFWRERIRAAYAVREAVGLVREDNNTFRLIHGEGDNLPGLIVDIYGSTAVVQAHSVGMHLHRMAIAEALVAEVKQVERVYYKSDDTLPFKADIKGDKTGWLLGTPHSQDEEYWAVENGLAEGVSKKRRPDAPGIEEHGWGLRILAELARRHDGELTAGAEGGVFVTQMALLV